MHAAPMTPWKTMPRERLGPPLLAMLLAACGGTVSPGDNAPGDPGRDAADDAWEDTGDPGQPEDLLPQDATASGLPDTDPPLYRWIYSRGTSGFGLIDSTTGTWVPQARAFLRPAPALVGGEPRSYSWDPTAGRMTFLWQHDGRQETEVLLPEWIRTVGFDCTLDGPPLDPVLDPTGSRIRIPPGPAGTRTFTLQVRGPYPD